MEAQRGPIGRSFERPIWVSKETPINPLHGTCGLCPPETATELYEIKKLWGEKKYKHHLSVLHFFVDQKRSKKNFLRCWR